MRTVLTATFLAIANPGFHKTAPSADSACMGGKNTDQIAEELENQLKELRDFLIEKNATIKLRPEKAIYKNRPALFVNIATARYRFEFTERDGLKLELEIPESMGPDITMLRIKGPEEMEKMIDRFGIAMGALLRSYQNDITIQQTAEYRTFIGQPAV